MVLLALVPVSGQSNRQGCDWISSWTCGGCVDATLESAGHDCRNDSSQRDICSPALGCSTGQWFRCRSCLSSTDHGATNSASPACPGCFEIGSDAEKTADRHAAIVGQHLNDASARRQSFSAFSGHVEIARRSCVENGHIIGSVNRPGDRLSLSPLRPRVCLNEWTDAGDVHHAWAIYELLGFPSALEAGTLITWGGWHLEPPKGYPLISAYFLGALPLPVTSVYLHHIHVRHADGLDFQVHGDSICMPDQGGEACLLFDLPSTQAGAFAFTAQPFYRSDGAFVVTQNLSSPLIPMVAFRFSRPASARAPPLVPVFLLNFANKGPVPPFATFMLPKEGFHAQWFTTHVPYSGWAVHAFIHTHTRVFHDVLVFANSPASLNLDRGALVQDAWYQGPLLNSSASFELLKGALLQAKRARLLCKVNATALRHSADPAAGGNLLTYSDTGDRLHDRATPLDCVRSFTFKAGDPITVVAMYKAGSRYRRTDEWERGASDTVATPRETRRKDAFLQHMGLRIFSVRKDAASLSLREAGRADCPTTWATFTNKERGEDRAVKHTWTTCG